jgi:hypothetical protein
MQRLSHELVRSIRSAWRNLESLEKEVLRSFGPDDPVSETIGSACICLMNADIELEDYPDREINRNLLEATTLDQIFDTLDLIRGEAPGSHYDLIDATARAFKTSENFYNVHRNTIRDACTRRLQLNVGEFRELVRKWLNGDPSGLKAILKSHTPEHYHSEIDRFFTEKISH